MAGNLSGTYFFTKIANKTGKSGDEGDQGKVSPSVLYLNVNISCNSRAKLQGHQTGRD